MKNIFGILLLSVLAVSPAFAGTTISYDLPLKTSADFFKNDVNNFRIYSVSLDKAIVRVTKTTDEKCVANSDNLDLCDSYSYVYKDVVKVAVVFDSISPQYADGANSVELVLPQDNFSAQQLTAIKNSQPSNANLIKLAVSNYSEVVPTPDDSKSTYCNDADPSCQDHVVWTTTTVQKTLVQLQK